MRRNPIPAARLLPAAASAHLPSHQPAATAFTATLVTLAAAAALTALTSSPAAAGVLVKQNIEATATETPADTSQPAKKSAYKSTHVWRIDAPKFNLTVTTGKDETQYIFNGRTLYVCGQLDEAQLKVIEQATAGNSKLFERFHKGVCQAVPSNFMARFFLAPMVAVESVEAADGLNLTLSLQGYSVKPGKSVTAAGQACTSYTRHFVLTKANAVAGGKPRTSTLDETSCMSPDLAWRSSLWTEVAKVVMRQPGGQAMLKQLKQDAAALPGLQLQSEVKHDRVFSSGSRTQTELKLVTAKVSDEEFPKALFLTPVGYQLFSPETLDLAGLASAPAGAGGKASAPAAAPKKDEELIDMVRSAFFCALAGPLGCITN